MASSDEFESVIANITTGDSPEVVIIDSGNNLVGNETVDDQVKVLGLLQCHLRGMDTTYDVDVLSAVLEYFLSFLRLHLGV